VVVASAVFMTPFLTRKIVVLFQDHSAIQSRLTLAESVGWACLTSYLVVDRVNGTIRIKHPYVDVSP